MRLLTAEAAMFEVVDMAGRVTYRQALELPAGDQMLDVPASAMPQSGLYIWRLNVGAGSHTGKIRRVP
jgi:hypothetical protein